MWACVAKAVWELQCEVSQRQCQVGPDPVGLKAALRTLNEMEAARGCQGKQDLS